ncbi:MAG: GNAT family N-acetyltransferase [Clostridia bacterium]|nr:GNAT family N-acetyltransferase [Clostridia bacterium]MBR5903304.1 GNAT family N-acetyltransferase [Clostridia bacterium]
MSKNITLRPAQERDIDFILRVNEENVEVLSPMDEAKLRKFMDTAAMVWVAEVDSVSAGFIVTLREGLDYYKSENYLWFSRNYPEFLYIDRIVIDAPFRGIGIGRKFYEAVFEQAAGQGIEHVTCEIDTIPYNEPSLNFHKVMGFREVGEQFIRGGTIKVSLQEAPVKLG